jgi:hypothetical protein
VQPERLSPQSRALLQNDGSAFPNNVRVSPRKDKAMVMFTDIGGRAVAYTHMQVRVC